MSATNSHVVISHQDLIILTRWMAVEGLDAHEVADAVEKPWNWREDLAQAKAELKASVLAHPGGNQFPTVHTCEGLRITGKGAS
jgi:hypothetical protein